MPRNNTNIYSITKTNR